MAEIQAMRDRLSKFGVKVWEGRFGWHFEAPSYSRRALGMLPDHIKTEDQALQHMLKLWDREAT